MFTGIVEDTCPVIALRPTSSGQRLVIDLGRLARGVKTGDSIAVNGCCLTVAALAKHRTQFDIVPETLRLTTLSTLTPGARVNIERACRIGDRLDGHIVQGHVDGVVTVAHVTDAPLASSSASATGWGAARTWTFRAPSALLSQLVLKGSIAIDGISLTIASLTARTFSVAIIPETLRRTTLGSKLHGAQCHVELDVLGKYVQRYLAGLAPAPRGRAGTRKRTRRG